MEGMQEGTLFDKDVVEAEENASRCTSTAASSDGDSLETVRDLALGARTASRKLAACPTEVTCAFKTNLTPWEAGLPQDVLAKPPFWTLTPWMLSEIWPWLICLQDLAAQSGLLPHNHL